MFLHPGIIALTIGSGIVLLLILSAALLGIRILRRWDIKSSSEEQLSLERKTYLVSILVQYALSFEILSVFLFIYTADDIHTLLVGAMCATGSLNANPYGFPTLYAKIVTFFVSASWIAINYLDNKAEDYPLITIKYKLLIGIVPIVLAESALQLQYFLNINPNVITSCCGFMFSEEGKGIGSSLASLPILPTKITFYSLLTILLVNGIAVSRTPIKPFTYLLSISSLLFFIVSIISIITFISLYFYQLPTHHCPFDILQKEYHYVGYSLYVSLFSGTFFGMMVGFIEPFKKISLLRETILQTQHRWSLYAIIGAVIFALISTAPMVLLPFTLEGY